jgi:murein DD-endopeptidase MepM/ murein hydrolase activator NlpD
MIDRMDFIFFKLRFVFVGLLMAASLLLLVQLMVAAKSIATNAPAKAGSSQAESNGSKNLYDDPNVVAVSLSNMTAKTGQSLNSMARSINNGANAVYTTTVNGGKTFARGTGKAFIFVGRGVGGGLLFAARGIGSGFLLAGRGVGNGFAFIGRSIGSAAGFAARSIGIGSFVRPAKSMQVPVIEPYTQVQLASQTIQPIIDAGVLSALQVSTEKVWPIHGRITTLFGVPHWPYQPTHTGLDIISGQRSGITPIKSFRSGRVISAGRSSHGLGNQVVVDHGGGITSVYGHMSSISVQSGQTVDSSTTLGHEGSTGVSTGTHLHFEIRVDGKPVNPLQFMGSRP